MKTKLCVFAVMAAFCTGAPAGSFSHLDRSDDAEIHSHTALSNDIYVKGFGLSLGVLGVGAEDDDARGPQLAMDDDKRTRQAAGLTIDLLAASADSVGYGGGLGSGCWKPASSLAPRR
ncbi:hypothetical protein J5T34_23710 [Cupriavidus gilardii]|uniref:hypothetical protein n=1 Tax=Cupriavidus gilardii TaxID=82541 RepID=UPI001ABDD514|nr:hypothetical protein [Cupriavidus gilardii]MBO4123744.1 hypothetical protein [Cupriavidus gilardii]